MEAGPKKKNVIETLVKCYHFAIQNLWISSSLPGSHSRLRHDPRKKKAQTPETTGTNPGNPGETNPGKRRHHPRKPRSTNRGNPPESTHTPHETPPLSSFLRRPPPPPPHPPPHACAPLRSWKKTPVRKVERTDAETNDCLTRPMGTSPRCLSHEKNRGPLCPVSKVGKCTQTPRTNDHLTRPMGTFA